MTISDSGKAADALKRIGYYRLSGYWYPFRRSRLITDAGGKPTMQVLDTFREGATFSTAVDLYVFDKKLRLLLLDALERIEVALRVDVAFLLGARDPIAHRNGELLHGNFTKKVDPKTGKTKFEEWLVRLDQLVAHSKEEFAVHFKERYSSPMPIWMVIELWDFGLLSKFISGMKVADIEDIARKYNIPDQSLLTSWMRTLNQVRNICAHHCRIWNRPITAQPKMPRLKQIPELDHLYTDKLGRSRLYVAAALIQFFLKTINPTSSWGERLKTHFQTFPTGPGINAGQTGFHPSWQELSLWN